METTKFLGKSILKNKILIISIIVLLSSILFLYNYLFLGVLDVNNNYESMKDKSDVSDCQYIPELELSDDEILDIVKEYEIPLSEIEDDDVIEKYNVFFLMTKSLKVGKYLLQTVKMIIYLS